MSKEENKKVRYSSLVVDAGSYKTLLTEKYKNRKKYVEKDPKLVKAFLPGTIVDVIIKPGKKVIEGEKLLVLEAMKMKNNIVSHVGGKVKKVLVKKGQLVSKDEVMVEIE